MHKTKISGPSFFSKPTVTVKNYNMMLEHYGMPNVLDSLASSTFE